MEDNTVRTSEIEEINTEVEVTKASEDSNAGAFVAGIVGGFLAYAFIGGAKKLAAFVGAKLEARKNKETPQDNVIEAEIVEVDGEKQADSDEETPTE